MLHSKVLELRSDVVVRSQGAAKDMQTKVLWGRAGSPTQVVDRSRGNSTHAFCQHEAECARARTDGVRGATTRKWCGQGKW